MAEQLDADAPSVRERGELRDDETSVGDARDSHLRIATLGDE
jgi:hypothetical protein